MDEQDLIDVTLDYVINGERVTYTRGLTQGQLAELVIRLDDPANENEEG